MYIYIARLLEIILSTDQLIGQSPLKKLEIEHIICKDYKYLILNVIWKGFKVF